MTALPVKGDLDGSSGGFNQGVFKTAIGNLRDFIAQLFGTNTDPLRTVHETFRLNGPGELHNLSVVVSFAGNAMTLSMKTRAGAAPSTSDPVLLGLRNAPASAGDANLRAITAAQTLVVSAGSTLGLGNGDPGWIYVYQIDNAGVLELAVSTKYFGSQGIVTTVAEGGAGGADSGQTMYSSAARANVAFRCIARLRAPQAAAGTWVTAPSMIELWPFDTQALPRGHLAGLTLANNGVATKLDVAGGACRDGSDAADIVIPSAITAGLIQTAGVWAAGSNQNKLDTGARANNTWYHVFAIRRDSDGAGDWLFSLSASAPTMPGGYTYKRRIGSVLTDGVGNIVSFTQVGDEFIWATSVVDISGSTGFSARALAALSVPTGVKVWAKGWAGGTRSSATGAGVVISSPDLATDPGSAGTGTGIFASVGGATSMNLNGQFEARTNASGQVYVRSGSASDMVTVRTFGWADDRGKAN